MLPQQSIGGAGPSNSYAGVSSPGGYPSPPSSGQLGQALSYQPQLQQMPPPQQMVPPQQYPQQFQQSPPADMQSQLALPTPQQAAAGPVTALTAPPEHQQLQHQQTVPAGAAASPMKGLMRIFARKQPSGPRGVLVIPTPMQSLP
ncbi:hypothetical protein VOLCADRAFT_101222, partial [Volvox carteri f. nagariensis]